jgi:EAL and modified HD-GYP domain-containing signal transduction protein
MLKRLMQKLFGNAPPPAAPEPVHAEGDAPSAAPSEFLQRDPVLDREQRIVAYNFAIRHPHGKRDWQASSRHFFDRALLDRLTQLDLSALTGRRLAFCALDRDALLMPELERLRAEGSVLMFSAVQGTNDDAHLAQARRLIAQGMRVGVDHRDTGPMADLAAYIQVPVAETAPPDLLSIVRDLRVRHPDSALVASGVDSVELFDACHGLGFDYFQGQHLTRRGANRPPNLNSQRLVVSQLISHLRRKESDFDKLAMIARQDLALTLRLLRYINSAAMGLRHKVGTLEQAMTYIGREGLYRWLTLLLFYDSRASQVDAALRETALTRGRFCELLARRRLNKAECEQAFVTGLLSLVDVLFSMPMEEALSHLGLPDEIHAALANHKGKYGAFLGLAVACERGDSDAIVEISKRLGVDAETVNSLHMEALTWSLDYDAGLNSPV